MIYSIYVQYQLQYGNNYLATLYLSMKFVLWYNVITTWHNKWVNIMMTYIHFVTFYHITGSRMNNKRKVNDMEYYKHWYMDQLSFIYLRDSYGKSIFILGDINIMKSSDILMEYIQSSDFFLHSVKTIVSVSINAWSQNVKKEIKYLHRIFQRKISIFCNV